MPIASRLMLPVLMAVLALSGLAFAAPVDHNHLSNGPRPSVAVTCPTPKDYGDPCESDAQCAPTGHPFCSQTKGALPAGCIGACVCFPGSATLIAPGGAAVSMADTRVGDEVQCYKQSTGAVGFCRVLAFIAAGVEEETDMLRVSYRDDSSNSSSGGAVGSITLSHEHRLWAADATPVAHEQLPFGHLAMANELRVGDAIVLGGHHQQQQLRRAVVTSIEQVHVTDGAYTLLVGDGATPVVNGVVASSFAVEDHTTNYLLYSPLWTNERNITSLPEYGVAGKDIVAKLPARYPLNHHPINDNVVQKVNKMGLADKTVVEALQKVVNDKTQPPTEERLLAAVRSLLPSP